jgi:hypothetical protein
MSDGSPSPAEDALGTRLEWTSRLGRYAEALLELGRGHELGSRRPGWFNPSKQWIRETERLTALDARLPALLKGDDRPADATEA